jgi:hypothetical protein
MVFLRVPPGRNEGKWRKTGDIEANTYQARPDSQQKGSFNGPTPGSRSPPPTHTHAYIRARSLICVCGHGHAYTHVRVHTRDRACA